MLDRPRIVRCAGAEEPAAEGSSGAEASKQQVVTPWEVQGALESKKSVKLAGFGVRCSLLCSLPKERRWPTIRAQDSHLCVKLAKHMQVEAGEDGVDYDKLIETFGCQPISAAQIERIERLTGHWV